MRVRRARRGPARPAIIDKQGKRRLLQLSVALACIVPLSAGGAGMVGGTAMIDGPADGTLDGHASLENHFRYLSGLLFGIGVGFAAAIPTIERRSELFLMLSGAVIVGGLARLFAVLVHGPDGTDDHWALTMELIVVPLLLAWQRKVALDFKI